jgi:hypothetical protein
MAPNKVTETDLSPDDPTIVSSHSAAPQQRLSTGYGAFQQNLYEPPNPYTVSLQPPPPPRRRSTVLIVLLVGAIVLLVAGSGVIYDTSIFQPNQLHAQASATAQVQSAASATAFAHTPQGLYSSITSGTPVLNDPLSQSDSNTWSHSDGCVFTGAAYHVNLQKRQASVGCAAQSTNFGNLAYQVEMTLIKGDYGGIFFRATLAKFGEYDVLFSQTGIYYILLSMGTRSIYHSTILQSGTAPSFRAGLNRANMIAVVARGSTISLYVNKQYVTSVTDSTLRIGSIGVRASENSLPTEVVFRNAQVWNT